MNFEEYWAEVFRLVEQQTKPSVKLVYKLYYDPHTLIGTVVTYEDLPGVFVVVDNSFIFNRAADYKVIDGKPVDMRPTATIRLQTGGNVYYTLHNDNQFAVSADYPGAQGWGYGRVS
jgi:hypothetical protein